jgi:hypothetical protein
MVEEIIDQTEQASPDTITHGLSGFTLSPVGREVVSRELLRISHHLSTVIAQGENLRLDSKPA